MITKGESIKIGGDTYEVLAAFPGAPGPETVIVRYEGLLVFAVNRGGMWSLEGPEDGPPTEEQKAALRQLVDDSGTLDTTVVDVVPE